MQTAPPRYRIVAVKLWGTDRWMVLLEENACAGVFASPELARAFAERMTK